MKEDAADAAVSLSITALTAAEARLCISARRNPLDGSIGYFDAILEKLKLDAAYRDAFTSEARRLQEPLWKDVFEMNEWLEYAASQRLIAPIGEDLGD